MSEFGPNEEMIEQEAKKAERAENINTIRETLNKEARALGVIENARMRELINLARSSGTEEEYLSHYKAFTVECERVTGNAQDEVSVRKARIGIMLLQANLHLETNSIDWCFDMLYDAKQVADGFRMDDLVNTIQEIATLAV